MLKKIVSFLIVFAMLIPFTSAVAADNSEPTPTVEEILNGYHEKAFAAQSEEADGSASTYSRRSGKTLEQETVDELTAAGYEAYNVTANNYAQLENDLKTDLSELGIEQDGSYIIVISGEEEENSNPGSNSRVIDPPHYDEGDDTIGSNEFNYTYNGTTYRMRYVTVTAADNNQLGMTSYVDLLDEYDVNDMWDDLNVPVSILSSFGPFATLGFVYSLFSIIPEAEIEQFSTFLFHAGTNWTIKYVQVFDSEEWIECSSAEYVTMNYFTNYTYYDASINGYVQDSAEDTLPSLYSNYYTDTAQLKYMAAISFDNFGFWADTIEYVEYAFDDEVLIVHQRPFV